LKSGTPSVLGDLVGGDLERITFESVIQAADQGDAVALGALQEVGVQLGIGVANLVNVFNPELIVLGGALNRASSVLLPIVEKTISENALTPARENLRVAASAHGTDACLIGAIALVLEDILREPISV
jgi:predicted NBD/HSP70 family sugar kinase